MSEHNKENILFICEEHKIFYYESIKRVRQTSGSMKVVRMAFGLYCNHTPSVYDYGTPEEQMDECRRYTAEDLFCCSYAPYFWQAVQIRYPEYTASA